MPAPDLPNRDQLEQRIVDYATNDATIWKLLVNPQTTRKGLSIIFGAAPPPGVNVTVVAEDATTMHHVIPAPEEADITAGPRSLAPRQSFQRRVNYLLHTDQQFAADFARHPAGAIANALQFRFPSHVKIVPLQESSSKGPQGDVQYNLYIVLPYSAHDALFDSPYALLFNGRDASVTIPFSASLDIRDAITVETWFRASAFRAGNWQDPLVSMHGQAAGWELRVGGAVPRFMITIGGTHYYAQPANPTPFLKTRRWYYLVGSYGAGALRLFLDGAQLYTTTVSGPMTPYQKPMTIGRNSNADWADRFFEGEVDEVRVWSRILPLPELRQYRPRKGNGAPPDVADPALRAYYPMETGTGIILPDRSGNNNHGKIVNATWVTIPENAP